MGIETQIQTQLEATSALTDEVGTDIHRYQRQRGATNADLPAVVWRRISEEIVNHSTGATATQWTRIQVDSFSGDMDTVRTVADAVTTALSGWSNTSGSPSISMCHQQSELDVSEEPEHGDDAMLFRITQDYRISHGA